MRLTWKPVSLQIWVRACYILLFIFCSTASYAQHIILKNPSLEGNPGRDSIPSGWCAAANTPDVLPGIFNIKKRASHGKTYVGLHSGPTYKEGIAQQLDQPLTGGMSYSLSLDLAYAPSYVFAACYGNMTIYGGNSPGDTAEILWKSGVFTDTAWVKRSMVLMPSKNYTYISFWADPGVACDKSSYGCALLMDNISDIRQILKTATSASASCPNSNTGAVAVTVTSGHGPFTYLWTPGNYTTAQVDRLPAGVYNVQVTADNGTTASAKVTVEQSDFSSKIAVTTSDCHGDGENAVKFDVTGGTPPYRYYMDGYKNGFSSSPVFNKLSAGYHQVFVKDVFCTDTFDVMITEPAPFKATATVTGCSCSETNDGKILLEVKGGTLPYQYRLYNERWKEDSVIGELKSGYYQYEVRDAKGCSVEGNVSISSSWNNCTVVMPNAFSPNGDGSNDLFKPKIYEPVRNYQLTVFNRWGAPVFNTADPNVGWDGGQLSSQAFIYVCKFTDRHNEAREYKGSLMLIR